MTDQPTRAEWATADEFAQLVQEIDPAKARTLIATIVASTPKTLEQARNVLRDRAALQGKN